MTQTSANPCALVTGAGQGIGRGIALHLAAAGYDITANDVLADPANTAKGLYEVKGAIEKLGRRCLPVQGDVANRADHRRLIDAAVAEFGSIDLLVNNAGVAPRVRMDILETTEESYDRLMSINLRGPFFLTQSVAAQMIRQVESGAGGRGAGVGSGAGPQAAGPPDAQCPLPNARSPVIVFISSISAAVSSPARAEYCLSKAGVSMAARLFADRLARHGICVFEVRPGIIATDMTAAVKEKYDNLIAGGLLPQARWGTPDDVGQAVVALARGYFNYSTGQIIEVGGGFGIPRL